MKERYCYPSYVEQWMGIRSTKEMLNPWDNTQYIQHTTWTEIFGKSIQAATDLYSIWKIATIVGLAQNKSIAHWFLGSRQWTSFFFNFAFGFSGFICNDLQITPALTPSLNRNINYKMQLFKRKRSCFMRLCKKFDFQQNLHILSETQSSVPHVCHFLYSGIIMNVMQSRCPVFSVTIFTET